MIAVIFLSAGCMGEAEQITSDLSLEPGEKSEPIYIDEQADKDMDGEYIIAEKLTVPWEIVFLPDGDLLVTERNGTIAVVSNGFTQRHEIQNTEAVGEGGLLGMVLHPDYKNNKWIYVYQTTREQGALKNRILRFVYDNRVFNDQTTILDNIPANNYHNGGRLEFGPDAKLYVTTGDAGNGDLSQNINSLAGKILRLNDDGSTPDDNPFGNAVWSYGHRNSQGLAWDDLGRLWATEHGRSGALSGYDELNVIEKGKNYGWPIIQGNGKRVGMEAPEQHSGSDNTWAPAGMTYLNNRLYFAGLRGRSMYVVHFDEDGELYTIVQHPRLDTGRLRAVKTGSDGYIYVTTSNTDGRGEPNENDDLIIKYSPNNFMAGDVYIE